MASMTAPGQSETADESEKQPDYLVGVLAGVAAGLVLIAMRVAVSHGTLSPESGLYWDVPAAVAGIGLATGMAVRFGGGNIGDWGLALIAGLITFICLFASEYLIALDLVNTVRSANGINQLPLLMPPGLMIQLVWDFVTSSAGEVILWPLAVGGAVFLNVVDDSKRRSLK